MARETYRCSSPPVFIAMRSMSSKWGIAGSKGSKEGGIEEATKGGKRNINEKQIKTRPP